MNTAADTLSRLQANALHTGSTSVVYFHELAVAQADDPELSQLQYDSLKLQSVSFLSEGTSLICDTSTDVQHPYVPQRFRRPIFDTLHSISHPGIRATQRLVTSRFVWPSINRDVRQWARSCLQCRRSKVHRHVATPLGTFASPDARFLYVHIDLIGPFPPSNGHVYLLTCIDQFTRWPEVVPIGDGSALTVAKVFIQIWVSRIGVPATITTDCGGQFESALWKSITQLLGTSHIRTISYHLFANGMVERFHYQLKSSLKASPRPDNWTDMLYLTRTTKSGHVEYTGQLT